MHDQSTIKPLARHPVANVFPKMTDEHYSGLVASIRAVGQQSACLTWNGLLVDGCHREQACIELSITCKYVEIEAADEADMIDKVAALNMHRRHLTPTQRGVTALRLKEAFSVAARERQKAAGVQGAEHGIKGAEHGVKGGRGRKKQPLPHGVRQGGFPAPAKPREATSSERAAAAVGVSARTVEKVAAVAKAAPDLVAKMASGELTASKAREEITRRAPAAPKPTPVQKRSPVQVRGKRSELIDRLSAISEQDLLAVIASVLSRKTRAVISEIIDVARGCLDREDNSGAVNADDAPASTAREEGYA